MNSLKYIPSELKDKDLYDLATRLIDHVYEICNDSRDNKLKLETPLIKDLVIQYKDIEAVNAYYNLFIKPIIGTRKSIETILSIIRDPGKIYEWFDVNIRNYRYLIQYDTYQNESDILRMIHLCKALNNERSRLTVINSAICRLPLKYDESAWDVDFYDNAEGVLVEDVYVCLNIALRYYLYVPTLNFWQQYVNSYTGFVHLLTEVDRWDAFRYDTRYRGDFINQITTLHYRLYTKNRKTENLEYFGYDTLEKYTDKINRDDPYYLLPFGYSTSIGSPINEQLLELPHELYQNNFILYPRYYKSSSSNYKLEDIYFRCGSVAEMGVSPIGYIETKMTDELHDTILDAHTNYELNYPIDYSAGKVNFNIVELYNSSGIVNNNPQKSTIDHRIYQTLSYVDFEVLQSMSSSVLQELSSYYSNPDNIKNLKLSVYDGSTIVDSYGWTNGLYPNSAPSTWSSMISLSFNPVIYNTDYDDPWIWSVMNSEVKIKSVSDTTYSTSGDIYMPKGYNTIYVGKDINPIFIRISYNLFKDQNYNTLIDFVKIDICRPFE